MRSQSHEVADILVNNYSRYKFSPLFTLWGVIFHWDKSNSSLSLSPVENSEYQNILEQIISNARMEGEKLIKPLIYVPKNQNISTHYSLLCMRNRSVFTEGFMQLLDGDYPMARPIIDDSLLLEEAASTYTSKSLDGAIPEKYDFFDFLLKYNSGKMESNGLPGQFSSLLERLIIRFELSQDIFSDLRNLIKEENFQALSLAHYSAIEENKVKLNKDLIEACRIYNMEKPQYEIEDIARIKFSPKNIFGKRRIKVGFGSGSMMDLEEYSERMRNKGSVNIDPNEILEQRLVNSVIASILNSYKENPFSAISDLEQRAKKTSNTAEAKALNKALELLKYMSSIEESPSINHTMIINRKIK